MNEIPAKIKSRIEEQDESCICNDDFSMCLCCETVATYPGVACDLVIDGEEVTGPATAVVDLATDGKGGVKVRRFDANRQYE